MTFLNHICLLLKHLFLYFLSNLIGASLFSLLFAAFGGDGMYSSLTQFTDVILAFTMFGLALNLIPYLVLLVILKSSNKTSIALYALAGAMCPVLFSMLFVAIILGFMPVLSPIGAICGAFYGYLDKKIKLNFEVSDE